jgi:ABC-type transport system substrate-binding protein
VAERPATLDPLYATAPAEQLAARQVHEPLVERLRAPDDRGGGSPGLALTLRPSADATVWRATLRPGVRFHDGQPFNAAAVLANVDRWLAVPAGRAALGGDLLVDAPRPDQVRFILPAPDAAFDERLAAPELGLVSPAAIEAAGGAALDPRTEPDSGTGAFELREGTAGSLLLARNTAWWGTERGLGPGVDQVELRAAADPDERLDLLAQGVVRVAEVAPDQLDEVRADPLLAVVRQGAGRAIGIERSVQGIPPGVPVPSLNAVWIAGIDGG